MWEITWEMAITSLLILMLVILLYLVFAKKKESLEDLENALSRTWIKMGLGEKISLLSEQAKEIQKSYRSFEQLLKIPKERASFGEISLETIISDQLPPDMFGIRKEVWNGKKPDAHIRSAVGIICIDSKFPLDNYQKMIEAEDPKEKNEAKTNFKKDVEKHLLKIATDYVCPEKGSAEFAFAYIPSESVAYYLMTEESEMLLRLVKKGVQVVSPLTLSQKVELIRAGVYAKHLSENALTVRDEILKLASSVNKVDEIWKTIYDTHIRNLANKANEFDLVYKKLKSEFDNIQNKDIGNLR